MQIELARREAMKIALDMLHQLEPDSAGDVVVTLPSGTVVNTPYGLGKIFDKIEEMIADLDDDTTGWDALSDEALANLYCGRCNQQSKNCTCPPVDDDTGLPPGAVAAVAGAVGSDEDDDDD